MKALSLVFLVLWYLMSCSMARVQSSEEEGDAGRAGVVLALGAANGWINGTALDTFSNGSWSFEYADLDGFGDTMRQEGFQTALDQFAEPLRLAIHLLKPSVVVVASKGLNILTHLALTGVYSGPAVLLSPIPNACDHIRGTTWEQQWTESINVLVEKMVGPIGIGVGTSIDEQSLIVDMINETQVCGHLHKEVKSGQIHFELCPNWFLRSFPGGHDWKNREPNTIHVASLINDVLAMDRISVTAPSADNPEL